MMDISGYPPMDVVKISSDGNCCFNAILCGIQSDYTPQNVRSIISLVMEHDPFYFRLVRDDLIDLGMADNTLTLVELKHRILRKREWGTGTMIHILAQFFDIIVLVHGFTNNTWVTQRFPLSYCEQHKPPFNVTSMGVNITKQIIHLLATNSHFDLLRPR